jgi:MoaA/NifB/PqqE/SkfB family radical SAM enzyme
LIAHVIVCRRCNLSCGYCTEWSKTAKPVPRAVLAERFDHLARLKTLFVTLTGGEALLHPELEQIVADVRARGMIPVMNTNGFLLTRARIEALNAAGLFAMQLSIDNLEPDTISVKSLRPLCGKLRLLAPHARCRVRVNTVLGANNPREAIEVTRAVHALGFDAKVSLVRDERGQVMPVSEEARRAYDEIRALGSRAPWFLSENFQTELVEQGRVEWKCRSGARYFMVCEDGLVHYCESSFGSPGTPLARYTVADIRRAFATRKGCAQKCAVAYAHQASRADELRSQPLPATDFPKQPWSAWNTQLVQLRLSRAE